MNIVKLFEYLLKIGVNLTDDHKDVLKWRISKEGRKYYSDKENEIFYTELLRGNMDIVNAIRKEKQDRINKLKQDLLLGFMLCLISLSLIGCIPMNNGIEIPLDLEPTIATYNPGNLKTTEQTFSIITPRVRVQDEENPVQLEGEWIAVHPDYIKEHNENQDTLIKALEKLKESKVKDVRQTKMLVYGSSGFCILIFISFVILLIKRK